MKRMLCWALSAMLLVAGVSGIAHASDTATVSVSATVVGTCKFNSGGTLDFGSLTSGDVTVNASPQPEFWCTKNTTYTITDDDGLNEVVAGTPRLSDGSGNYINYSISYTSTGTGNGVGSPRTLDLSGTVLESDYTAVPAGSYSDTITLTINP